MKPLKTCRFTCLGLVYSSERNEKFSKENVWTFCRNFHTWAHSGPFTKDVHSFFGFFGTPTLVHHFSHNIASYVLIQQTHPSFRRDVLCECPPMRKNWHNVRISVKISFRSTVYISDSKLQFFFSNNSIFCQYKTWGKQREKILGHWSQ